MSEMNPIDSVIADAVDDSAMDATVTPDTSEVDASFSESTTPGADVVADATSAVDSPAVDAVDPTTPVQDEFEKRWGIPAVSVTGRENRIPHSRVKSMVTKAEQDGYGRGLKEAEGKVTPQLTEFQTKVKDYEGRLEQVAQFEQILEKDPRQFLQMLSQVPAYKEFFDYIGQLSSGQPQQPQNTLDHSDMPQPDQTLTDGSKVYSLEGLAQRDEWLAKKIEDRAVKQAEELMSRRYQPMEQEWQNQQRMAQLVPVIEKQIAEARTWPNFAELEPEVVKLLNADPHISLERAYVKAYQEQVVPKVSADRNKIRTELLAELKQKPVSSSAPSSAVRPGQPAAGPRTIEQIIADSAKEAGLF